MTNQSRRLNVSGIFKMVLLTIGAAALFVSGFYAAERTARHIESDGPIKHEVLIDEAKAFVERMGMAQYSSHEEELFVRDFFSDIQKGVFVDIGASHYRDRSNTYYLETKLGWSGLAIDPLPEFAADYRTHRPRTKYPYVRVEQIGRASDPVRRKALAVLLVRTRAYQQLHGR